MSDIHLSPRQRKIIDMALSYFHSCHIDDANGIILENTYGFELDKTITGEEVQELRENLSPDS